ncbi:sensor histidine kinase [Geodermatophilus marinus]|uniref:sensor histidine kinase n=1 Tax=Geodermatophilus sp. LHW52908 TaxID=2303986 RepID=UPI000E3C3CE4|nr:ATP-binding protein [Geodermatophilus sp. LHW52908]RFU22993.1 hypothetical protein D0Z06_03905 [Geodermatophilus sp. LHW52908]
MSAAPDQLDRTTPPPVPRRPRRPARGTGRPRRELVAFCVTALLVLLIVSTGTVWVSERIARANALAEAERTAERLGQYLVAPQLPEVLAGVPGRREELDRAAASRMRDGSVTRMVVWSPDGEVLWSSDPELTGRVFEVERELAAAFAGETHSDVDEAPETAPAGTGSMLEVYAPLRAAGQDLAFEAYITYEGIQRQAALLRSQIIPMAIGALVLLQLVQIPIATSLARRVARQEAERTALMERSITASERERRAIAADVHDGPVQDLAGVSYALTALRGSVPEDRQPTVDRLVTTVRHAVASLRRLMVDIYPPDLSGPGLGAAVADLAVPLREQGTEAVLDVGLPPDLAPGTAAVLYRTAREALTNVAKHAAAGVVWITLEEAVLHGRPAVRLEVADDGTGLPEDCADRRGEGHLGLALLRDRVRDAEGEFTLGARAGGGTVLTAVVPQGHEE